MKKITLGLFALVLFSSGAFALYEGQILTQNQINNIEIENFTITRIISVMNCQRGNDSITFYNHNYWFVRSFSCLYISPYDYNSSSQETTYIVHRIGEGISFYRPQNSFFPAFRLKKYVRCVSLYGVESCNPVFQRELRRQGEEDLWNIKSKVIGYKDNFDWMNMSGFGGGLW